METLWDNVAKMSFSKGEKQGKRLGVAPGEKNIRDQIGEALNLIHQGKITTQQFQDRMTVISQGK